MSCSSFHMDRHGCTHLDVHMPSHTYHTRVHACNESCLNLRYSISPNLIRKKDRSLSSSLHSLLSEQRGEAVALGLNLASSPLGGTEI